eukprot:scaffold72737_cov19-Tisochrysis_lutea.AAC.1
MALNASSDLAATVGKGTSQPGAFNLSCCASRHNISYGSIWYALFCAAGAKEMKKISPFNFELARPRVYRRAVCLDLGPDGEDAKMALFAEYLEAEEQEKFEGSFQDFLHAIDREDLVEVGCSFGCSTQCSSAEATKQVQYMTCWIGRFNTPSFVRELLDNCCAYH